MKTSRQVLGHWGETLAAEFLCSQGYTILDRNARTPYGEIDLVASQTVPEGRIIVFVEVKTRNTASYGLPEEAVTFRKQAHLLAAAQAFLQAHPELERDFRVDVIAIQRSPSGQPPIITHFENAVH